MAEGVVRPSREIRGSCMEINPDFHYSEEERANEWSNLCLELLKNIHEVAVMFQNGGSERMKTAQEQKRQIHNGNRKSSLTCREK